MPQDAKPQIVVSAVNFSEMGPLTILKEVLAHLAEHYAGDYEVVALVHRRSLFDISKLDIPKITYMEFPEIKGSWFRRLKFEYFDLKEISQGLNAELWLSLHDMTPNVIARRQAVYCHNSSPFYDFRLRDALHDPTFGVFTLLYRFLYAINIKRNDYVVVQQNWMREEFKSHYGVKTVIVAHPCIPSAPARRDRGQTQKTDGSTRFFFPSYPRVFKNAELALEGAAILERSGVGHFELWLTFDGSENSYAAGLVRRYGKLKSVQFLGLLTRSEVFDRYSRAECLLFPSSLESWGLPISEFKPFHKPILAADLPYARESVGSYDQVAFFDPKDPWKLAELMRSIIEGKGEFESVNASPIDQPFCSDWAGLFKMMLPPANS
jgi:glycosyltransferase involved in cell wall biosynthesis